MKRIASRPENTHQAAILDMLRRDGPQSRAELGERSGLSRTKIGQEIDRLVALGLTATAGLAQSRGGRRSTVVRLSPDIRFLGIDVGATSVDVALTDGELHVLAHVSEEIDIRLGPTRVLDRVGAELAR